MDCDVLRWSMQYPKLRCCFHFRSLISKGYGRRIARELGDLKFYRNATCTSSLTNSSSRDVVFSNPVASCPIPRRISGNVISWDDEIADSKMVLKHYSEMLKHCSAEAGLKEGRSVHASFLKRGVIPDAHLWVSLIAFYSKCGQLVSARKVLDKMPERDVVSWTAMISGIINQGLEVQALHIYSEMRMDNVIPNEFSIATVLKGCSRCLNVEMGKQIHADAIKSGVALDSFVASALVDVYGKCGDLELANRVISIMPEVNSVSMNALLNCYLQREDGKMVLKLFSMMTDYQSKVSPPTLTTMLKACAVSLRLKEGKALHSVAIKNGCDLDNFLASSLLDMYCTCGTTSNAFFVFSRIRDPDIVSFSAMIAGLEQRGDEMKAAELFRMMKQKGLNPNHFTFSSLVSAATGMNNLPYGESIHACAWKSGVESEIAVANALIMLYAKNLNVQHAYRIFEAIPDPDLISWNSLLSGLNHSHSSPEGSRIFSMMLHEGMKPNKYTFISALRCSTKSRDVELGKQLHSLVVKSGNDDDDFVGTSIVDMYSSNGLIDDAEKVFVNLSSRDVFVWTTMISNYARSEQSEKALKTFNEMRRDCVDPNEFTFASCLAACSRLASVETGRQFQALILKVGHWEDVIVGTAMVDMYDKCGLLGDAERIFDGCASRDTISWNAMITGYSRHGRGEKALEHFKRMLDEGFLPDEATFVGVLSACCYMGRVEEAKLYFNSISEEYGLPHSIEQFVCMVSVLGRAGRFSEVEFFVEKHNLEDCPQIWEAILGACKLLGNMEVGERAAKKLLELQPSEDSTYILLSNLYAKKGRWEDVESVRTMMTRRGVKKEPGCSWVEVDGEVHVFLSGDCSHPQQAEIDEKLRELGEGLEKKGYVANTENSLHNVSEDEKAEHLMYHSERLAVAFAVIRTAPLRPIRIFKNLRICEDCHVAMKLLSDILGREIVVRDIKRFHHFCGGKCSCNDWW